MIYCIIKFSILGCIIRLGVFQLEDVRVGQFAFIQNSPSCFDSTSTELDCCCYGNGSSRNCTSICALVV